ncbi:hypothetical protein LTR53_016569 [Teratosphaeriaceae sp. CCFEE 6253]|nr:hypothetical protein LTR53_016569 [Teratosphaeriaceae sp. CCFEE 6253]
MPAVKVIIIGAGLAGSLLANGLQREGVEVKVYDRLANHAKREGYQIRLGGNALTGFRACLDPESIQSLVAKFGRAGGKLSSAPVIRDKQFRPVLDLGRFTTYSKWAPINRGLLRDALADPLYDAGILKYDARYDRYDVVKRNGQEKVLVWFEDGTCEECDILIGADGSHSKVNKQIGLNNLQKVDSHICFIAKSDLPTKRFLAMSPDLHEKPLMTFAENKALYFAAYLPDKEEPAQSAKGTIEVEEVAFDDSMSSCMFGVFIPTDQCPEDILQADAETKWQFLSGSLRSFAPQ